MMHPAPHPCPQASAGVLIPSPALRRAYGWLPSTVTPGSIYQGPTGDVVRVLESGDVDPVLPPGHPRPGIAADPCPRKHATGPLSADRERTNA